VGPERSREARMIAVAVAAGAGIREQAGMRVEAGS
jgi:hypothetical protein